MPRPHIMPSGQLQVLRPRTAPPVIRCVACRQTASFDEKEPGTSWAQAYSQHRFCLLTEPAKRRDMKSKRMAEQARKNHKPPKSEKPERPSVKNEKKNV